MKLTVIYDLAGGQEKRLAGLVEQAKKVPGGGAWTVESMFRAIMQTGSDHDIEGKLCFYEKVVRNIAEQLKEGGENGNQGSQDHSRVY